MTKEEIFNILNELTSYYSFGRILGYVQFETGMGAVGLLQNSQLANDKRLMASEKNLLTGLWINNVDLSKTSWDVHDDQSILDKLYSIMDELHNCYRFTEETTFEEQIKEIAFYEGDEGYDKQFIRFSIKKYGHAELKACLKSHYSLSVTHFASTYSKMKRLVEMQISRRIEATRNKSQRYISPLNAFTIKEKDLIKHFSPEERIIIDLFTTKLAVDRGECPIRDIADRNEYLFRPIIKLPDGKGRFIPDFNSIAIAFNETPMFLIRDTKDFKDKELGRIVGEAAEDLVIDILCKRFPCENIIARRKIRRAKTGNETSEIDVLLHVPESNAVVVFQVKSKRLKELSRQGNKDELFKDYEAAINKAYEQGLACIDCLKHYFDYESIKDLSFINSQTRFFALCITLDQYPTITTQGHCLLSPSYRPDIPPITMTALDLDEVIDMIPRDEFINYLSVRTELINSDIRGLNEMFYIGAYVLNALEGPVYISKKNITREHAIFGDYIYNELIQRGRKINSFDDIAHFIRKNPIPIIQCQ